MSASFGSFRVPEAQWGEHLDPPTEVFDIFPAPVDTAPPDVDPRPDGGRARRGRDGPRPSFQRRHLVALACAVTVLLVVTVFARALSEASLGTERAAQLRAENAQLQQRLDAGRREVQLVSGDAFVRLQARAYGFGGTGERVFALASGAPPPRAITPLGAPPPGTRPPTALDDWLELLFGR